MSVRAIYVLSAAVLIAVVGANGQAPARRPPAPTFYLVIDARTCAPDSIKVSGASNLPAGALIALQISDFDQDAWEDYSDPVYASLKEGGLFQGVLHPKTGKKFRRNLLARAYFSPVYVPLHTTQPPDVLKVVGSKGQYLGGLENPQAGQISGENHYLSTIASVPNCGER
jgi:hypothetical protein